MNTVKRSDFNAGRQRLDNIEFSKIIPNLCLADLLLVEIIQKSDRKPAIQVLNAFENVYSCNICWLYFQNVEEFISHLKTPVHIGNIIKSKPSKTLKYFHPVFTFEHEEVISEGNEDLSRAEAIRRAELTLLKTPKLDFLCAHLAADIIERRMKENDRINYTKSKMAYSGNKIVANATVDDTNAAFKYLQNESKVQLQKKIEAYNMLLEKTNQKGQGIIQNRYADKTLHEIRRSLKRTFLRTEQNKLRSLETLIEIMGQGSVALEKPFQNLFKSNQKDESINMDNRYTEEEKLKIAKKIMEIKSKRNLVDENSEPTESSDCDNSNIEISIKSEPTDFFEPSAVEEVAPSHENKRARLDSKTNESDLNKNSTNEATAKNIYPEVLPVLRLLAIFEDILGCLAPKITNLLSHALKFNKETNEQIYSEVLKFENCILLETAVEKLKGILQTSEVENMKMQAICKVIQRTTDLLEYAFTYNKSKENSGTDEASKLSTSTSDINQNQTDSDSAGRYTNTQDLKNSKLEATLLNNEKILNICPMPPDIGNKVNITSKYNDLDKVNSNSNSQLGKPLQNNPNSGSSLFGNRKVVSNKDLDANAMSSQNYSTPEPLFGMRNKPDICPTPAVENNEASRNKDYNTLNLRGNNNVSQSGLFLQNYSSSIPSLFGDRNNRNIPGICPAPTNITSEISGNKGYNTMNQGGNNNFSQRDISSQNYSNLSSTLFENINNRNMPAAAKRSGFSDDSSYNVMQSSTNNSFQRRISLQNYSSSTSSLFGDRNNQDISNVSSKYSGIGNKMSDALRYNAMQLRGVKDDKSSQNYFEPTSLLSGRNAYNTMTDFADRRYKDMERTVDRISQQDHTRSNIEPLLFARRNNPYSGNQYSNISNTAYNKNNGGYTGFSTLNFK